MVALSPAHHPNTHLQHLGIVPLYSVMEGRLSFVVSDIHLGMAVLYQLHQDLTVTLAACQMQWGAALLILCAVGAAVGGHWGEQ